MPTILEEVEIKLEFSDLERRAILHRQATPDGFMQSHPRTGGVHMSGILKPLAIAAKQLKANSLELLEEDEYPLLWALGVAWEEFVASLHPEMDYQPGELCRDGIYMTCDGLSVLPEWAKYGDGTGSVVEEMKFTFVSSNKSMLEQWMKLCQGKAYCYGYGPRLVRWHVAHVKGDYASFGPRYKRTLIEFTDKEVEQCWQMMVMNKQLAVAEKGS